MSGQNGKLYKRVSSKTSISKKIRHENTKKDKTNMNEHENTNENENVNENNESSVQNAEPFESVAATTFKPSTMKNPSKDENVIPEEIEVSKKFLLNFAKEYERDSQYPCRKLYDCMNDIRLEYEFDEAQKNMTPLEIYNDAAQLFQCGLQLLDNYGKNWKNANSLIETIMRKHYPKLQKRIDRIRYSRKDQQKLVYGDIDSEED